MFDQLKEEEEYRKTILCLLPLIWCLDGYYVSRREMKICGRWLNDKKEEMRDDQSSSNFQYNLNILFPPPSTSEKNNFKKNNDNMVNNDQLSSSDNLNNEDEEDEDEIVDMKKKNDQSSKLSLSHHVSSSFSLPTTSSHLPSTTSTKSTTENENKIRSSSLVSEVEEKREYFLNSILFSMPRKDLLFDEYRLNYLLDQYLSTISSSISSSSSNQPSSSSQNNNKNRRRSSFQVDGKSYNLSSHIISLILHLPSHILVDLEVLMMVELIYSIPPQVR